MNEKYIRFGLLTLGGLVAIIATVQFVRWIMPDPLNNQEIVEQTKYCETQGMKAGRVSNAWTYDVVKIICEPKGSK